MPENIDEPEVDRCAECDVDCSWGYHEIDGEKYCYSCRANCGRCGEYYNSGEQEYCEECYQRCPECEEITLQSRVDDNVLGRPMCRDCREHYRSCVVCEEWFNHYHGEIHSMSDTGNWVCEQHSDYCDDCSQYHQNGCPGRYGWPGVRGYGHTHPEMWLGGPLPKDERGRQQGYYAGFELEISSERGQDARKIHAWSERNLGVRIFDCKTDSSVRGFEIATQPMTPEYFEAVPWGSFFEMLNENFGPQTHRLPWDGPEPDSHGLHIHIGRVAFRTDLNVAAYAYLLGQANHLERIGRRAPTSYCDKVEKPVSAAIVTAQNTNTLQKRRVARSVSAGRSAINFGNSATIEIRAGRSTRSAQELRDMVRLVYVGADYIRHLSTTGTVSKPRALQWSEFAKWVAANAPKAFPSIANIAGQDADLDLQVNDLIKQPVNTVM